MRQIGDAAQAQAARVAQEMLAEGRAEQGHGKGNERGAKPHGQHRRHPRHGRTDQQGQEHHEDRPRAGAQRHARDQERRFRDRGAGGGLGGGGMGMAAAAGGVVVRMVVRVAIPVAAAQMPEPARHQKGAKRHQRPFARAQHRPLGQTGQLGAPEPEDPGPPQHQRDRHRRLPKARRQGDRRDLDRPRPRAQRPAAQHHLAMSGPRRMQHAIEKAEPDQPGHRAGLMRLERAHPGGKRRLKGALRLDQRQTRLGQPAKPPRQKRPKRQCHEGRQRDHPPHDTRSSSA
mgnify:CR=1 FL=1